jgi:hypothetical protein
MSSNLKIILYFSLELNTFTNISNCNTYLQHSTICVNFDGCGYILNCMKVMLLHPKVMKYTGWTKCIIIIKCLISNVKTNKKSEVLAVVLRSIYKDTSLLGYDAESICKWTLMYTYTVPENGEHSGLSNISDFTNWQGVISQKTWILKYHYIYIYIYTWSDNYMMRLRL